MTAIYFLSNAIAEKANWQSSEIVWLRIFLALGLFIVPGYDFGQREHLTAALFAPYVLVSGLRAGGKSLTLTIAIACGLFAGIAVGIKPYFLAVSGCIEIALLIYLRHWRQFIRAELLTSILVFVAYLFAIQIYAPGYFSEVLPAALNNYSGFKSSWLLVGERAVRTLAFPGLAILILVVIDGLRVKTRPAFMMMLAASTGFLIAMAVQQKGWAYQLYPAAFYLLLALGLLVGGLSFRPRLRRVVPLVGLLIGLVSAVKPTLTFVQDMTAIDGTKSRVDQLADLFAAHSGEGKKVFAFITSPRDVHPAILQSRANWAGSSGVLVYLPAYMGRSYGQQDEGRAAQIRTITEKYDRRMIAELVQSQPGIIVSQFGPSRLGIEGITMSYPDYFARYPEFLNLWQHYSYVQTVGSFKVFKRQ